MRILRICKKIFGGCILICLCRMTVVFGNEVVTRTGFVESIDLKAHRIVVDDNVYTFSTNTELILEGHQTNIYKLREGDFVLLTVKKGSSEILQIIIQSNGSKE